MNRSLGIVALVISVLSLSLVPVYGNAATAYIVSGMVSVPGGVIASNDKTDGVSLAGVLDFFIPSAEARLYGLVPVPNGTAVELVRMGDRGGTSAPIATTTTQYGRYRFNLSALRLTVSPRLVVRVSNVATGAQMRAFVTDKTVNINPVSETTVRLVLDTVASTQGGTLVNFTVTELEDLFGSLDLLTSSSSMRTDADIESSVLAIRNAVAGNRGIVNFLTACARLGQTSTGPGDIGNYFPFTQGVSWTYTVQETEDGVAAVPFTNTVTVNGTRVINGIATTLSRDSNPNGDGKPDFSYSRKISSGVFDWSPVKDGTRNSPYRSARFPAAPGSSFQQSLGDMGLSKDLDRDGIIDRFNFTSTTTVIGLETVNVPAGTLQNSLKIRTVIVGSATVSSTRKRVALTVTAVEWYTRNLGLTKQILISRLTYNGNVWRDTRVEKLTEAKGFPYTSNVPATRWTTVDVDAHYMIYEPISRKLYASVPSDASSYANNIVVIDPLTGQIEASIPVGTNPGPLAASDDGQFLYVGLGAWGAQGSVRRISIPTLTVGPEWILGYNPPNTTDRRYPYDIAVQPGNANVIVITTNNHPFGYFCCPTLSAGTILMNDGVELTTSAALNSYGALTFVVFGETPAVAYGVNRLVTDVQYLLSVDETGIAIAQSLPNAHTSAFGDIKYQNGRIYDETGAVFDAATGTRIGSLISESSATPWEFQIAPSSTSNKIAWASTSGGKLHVEFFSAASLSKLNELMIDLPNYGQLKEALCWGTDGLAARLDTTDIRGSRIILVRTPSLE